jgi:hypothetical protein
MSDVATLLARALAPMLTLGACTSPKERPAVDRWAPHFAPIEAEAIPIAHVVDDAPGVSGMGEWFDHVHPCGRDARRPRSLCIAATEADPVPPWWPRLRKRSRKHSTDFGDWLEIRPAMLESVTGGVLRFELEHDAAPDACVWRLRDRDTDRVLITAYDTRESDCRK